MFGKKKVVEMRTVLFVDDDESILRSLERGLLDEPYNTLFTKSCKEALDILKEEEVHVVVTDMRMPEMDGLEFIQIIKKEYPNIIRMVLSGFGQDAALQTAENEGEIFKVIRKPWKLRGDFENLVRGAVDQYNRQNGRKAVKLNN